MTPLLAAALLAAANPAPIADGASGDAGEALAAYANAEAFGEDATAREILAACRAMVPTNVTISGHVNRRSRHGTEIAAYRFTLTRKNGETDVAFTDKSGAPVPFEHKGRLLDTDVRWNDLAMDFLWWDDVEFADPDGGTSESLHGIACRVIVVTGGDCSYKAWIDRRTGALLQAHELRGGKTVREIFCTSLKKFGDRWSPKNIEVGPPGAKYRTKIVIEDVR